MRWPGILLWIAVPLATPVFAPAATRAFLDSYCVACHNRKAMTAGLALDAADPARPGAAAEIWERVIEKLRAGSMPPPGSPRPDPAARTAVVRDLESAIDREWVARPNPGRIHAVHRLNRTEYNNAVRDLFGLDFDVRPQLPGDETADGSFDNVAEVLSISTAHLDRYLSVARQVSRLAAGLPPARPTVETYRIRNHILQDDRQSEDLPLGSRGGIAVRHVFPVDGEYLIRVRLQRQYQDYLKGMGWPQQLDVRLDGRLLRRFRVGGSAKGRPAAESYAGDGEPGFAGDPEWERYMQVEGDAGLEVRTPVTAGTHVVSASFVREFWEPEGLPQPLQRGRVIANDQVYMGYANVESVQIGGPYSILPVRNPKTEDEAMRSVTRTARLAYRRPLTEADQRTLREFFDAGRREGGSVAHGLQFALERVLVDPAFLLRVYRDRPAGGGAPYPLSEWEVASRLSFFLWASIPDDRLLSLAGRGELTRPHVLRTEVRRMLADSKSERGLVDQFAEQWLNLRRVEEVVVDPVRYPNYDESLLQAFKEETRLFLTANLREDRPVTELLSAGYTFVNERLARHYGIPGVLGSRFRRVQLPDPSRRGGLLAHGALLATTSYPDRTSPVLRGKWILNNLLGLRVPNPPPGLDTTLDARPGARPASIRERLAEHRRNPSCNSCHATIDPLGFALEHFDVIGGYRTAEESGLPVDAAGSTADGTPVQGLAGLRAYLLADPERFPRTVTAKLLACALGRRLEYYDQPAVREIVRRAAADGYRWSGIIGGIVESPPFLWRNPK